MHGNGILILAIALFGVFVIAAFTLVLVLHPGEIGEQAPILGGLVVLTGLVIPPLLSLKSSNDAKVQSDKNGEALVDVKKLAEDLKQATEGLAAKLKQSTEEKAEEIKKVAADKADEVKKVTAAKVDELREATEALRDEMFVELRKLREKGRPFEAPAAASPADRPKG